MKFRFILYIILSCLFLSASADNLTTAKQLYSEGKYSEALPLFMEQYKKNPKNGSINHWIGVCLYYEERYSESEKYFKYAETRKVNDATYFLALANYKQFKYSDANDYVDEYTELMAKSKKTIPNAFQANMQTITQASIMLDHVENIAIIDSLIVPKDKFFKYFKISPESFSLNDVEVLPAVATMKHLHGNRLCQIPVQIHRQVHGRAATTPLLHVTPFSRRLRSSRHRAEAMKLPPSRVKPS